MSEDFVCVTSDGGVRVRETMIEGNNINYNDEWRDDLFDFCPSTENNKVSYEWLLFGSVVRIGKKSSESCKEFFPIRG